MTALESPLAGLRVLDLATWRGALAGRVLAEFGADVITVEPPGGSPIRRLPPFEDALGHDPEGSLVWATVALGKRSAVLDIREPAGAATARRLAETADVVIESFDPGDVERFGLGYDVLSAANPGLVMVSVTPYGQDGPKATWPAADMVIEAAGGRVAAQGDHDRVPLPIGYPQSSFHAGAQAAADVLIALVERDRSGQGQHLDLSMQATMVWTLFGAACGTQLRGAPDGLAEDGMPAERARLLRRLPMVWPCADGFVALPLPAGGLPVVEYVMQLLDKNGTLDEELRDRDWSRLVADLLRQRVSLDVVDLAVKRVGEFLLRHTKAELFELAHTRDFRLGPLQTTRDLVGDPQLVARGYWTTVGGRVHPGPAVRMSRNRTVARPAPLLAGDSAPAPEWSAEGRTLGNGAGREPAAGARSGEAFAGLKVADFSWVAVGPTVSRALADHGATVVKVESERRLDVGRQLQPFLEGEYGLNRSQWFGHFNASKLGVAIDLSTDDGRAVARRLADWADVVIESYSPGTMAKLGLDYATLSAGHPELIMLSTSLLGQTGPYASFAGYGQQGVGLSGVSAITGWPDRAPCGPSGPYTDVVAPKYGIAALAAAIYDRARTGLGQYIDLSQVEASIHFIEPLVLDETVNGRTASAPGLDSLYASPHGVYPCAGERRYVAVSVETDDQRRALDGLTGGESIADWCAARDAHEAERALVDAGVPASVVQRAADVAHDSQLHHRGFFIPMEHTEMGCVIYEGLPTIFPAKQRQVHKAAPCLGEDTDYVLRDLLGMTDAEITRLRAAEILR